jgi:hypothetical protein
VKHNNPRALQTGQRTPRNGLGQARGPSQGEGAERRKGISQT